MELRNNHPNYLKNALASELFSVSLDLERAADDLQGGGGIEIAEALVHVLTQRLSLLGTAAICLQAGNEAHANRILEYVGEHKVKTDRSYRAPMNGSSTYSAVRTQIEYMSSELCAVGSKTE